MLDFVARKFDVLLATTIVENGLDIPNANTIIINRADRYGLSALSVVEAASADPIVRPTPTCCSARDNLAPIAKKRLAAIKEFSDLGSGFRVAALDLEIRGAGNLLGGEQSGHIEAMGSRMYMKLLSTDGPGTQGGADRRRSSSDREPGSRSGSTSRTLPT